MLRSPNQDSVASAISAAPPPMANLRRTTAPRLMGRRQGGPALMPEWRCAAAAAALLPLLQRCRRTACRRVCSLRRLLLLRQR